MAGKPGGEGRGGQPALAEEELSLELEPLSDAAPFAGSEPDGVEDDPDVDDVFEPAEPDEPEPDDERLSFL